MGNLIQDITQKLGRMTIIVNPVSSLTQGLINKLDDSPVLRDILTLVNSKVGIPFPVMYNPTTLSYQRSNQYCQTPTTGTPEAGVQFKMGKTGDLSVELLFDATGASPSTGIAGAIYSKVYSGVIGIDTIVNLFLSLALISNPKAHAPNISQVIWGSFYFQGFLQSADVQYLLFNRLGLPIRAKVTARFKSYRPELISKYLKFLSSPDVTKTHMVKAGDTLPLLALNEYGDEKLCIEIARVNGIKNFRKLEPGQILVLPAINKNEI